MFNFDKIDKTIHEKARLSIMTLLATRECWSFQDLKTELKMSDGNLITHLRILYDAGLVSKSREHIDRPQTNYAMTEKGKISYQEYLNLLEQIIKTGKN
ncbi:MAG: transcriptional regulator [Verrucomicrobiae bacterium]|nr:transcriptional regulator [Verrucomicrobiae bacterium]